MVSRVSRVGRAAVLHDPGDVAGEPGPSDLVRQVTDRLRSGTDVPSPSNGAPVRLPLSPPRRRRSRAHGRRRAARPARPARFTVAAQAFVLALVIAGTAAFATLDKTVTLEVDGRTTTVDVVARTVGDALDAQGVEVSAEDVVVPSPSTLLRPGAVVVVRHARDVVVEVDGERRTLRTTAQTVEEVLAEMRMREDVRTSVSRSAGVGRDVLRLSTTKQVTVVADGASTEVTTTAATVREALLAAGVELGERDRVSVPLDAAAVDGLVVLVTRVQAVPRTETTSMPFAVVEREDPRLPKGTEVVATAGVPGTRVVSVVAYELDGVEIGRTMVAESVLRAPVDQVVRVGTAELPDPADVAPVAPGTARAIGLQMVLARGWSEAEFACLDRLWTKESGWRTTAANPSSSAYGIPQALPGTKMASAGADWRTNPATQIAWGLGYIANRYGTPCGAWAQSQRNNWY